MSSLKQTTAPSLEPVSLDELMAHGRIIETNEGTLLESYITAARVHCENKVGQQFVAATWRKEIDRFPCVTRLNPHQAIWLDRPPLQSVTSLTYIATDGSSTVMPSSDYVVSTDSMPGYIRPKYNGSWPTAQFVPNAVSIVYIAGYGTTSSTASVAAVPVPAKTAIKVAAQYYYQERDTNAPMPQAVDALLSTIDHGNCRIPVPEDYL
jgi:uncharacterized phiE125 gp8 family phage protein